MKYIKKKCRQAGIYTFLITFVIAPRAIIMKTFPGPVGSSHAFSNGMFFFDLIPALFRLRNLIIALRSPVAFLLPGMGPIFLFVVHSKAFRYQYYHQKPCLIPTGC